MSEQNPRVPLAHQLSSRSRKRRAQSGAELVEFAMVLIPMLSLVFLAVDSAWAIYAKASLQEAVREGVRYGVISQGTTSNGVTTCVSVATENTSINNVVIAYSGGILKSSSNITIAYYSPSAPGTPLTTGQLTPGNILQVSVSGASLNLLAPFFVSKLPMSLSASAADVLEGSACA